MGKPRRTPVGDGRIGNQFWLVAEHGVKAGYVRNIERGSHVRLKLREGLQYRWHAPRRICFRTTTLVSANAGWQLNCRAARGMHEQCASSERNCSLFASIWIASGPPLSRPTTTNCGLILAERCCVILANSCEHLMHRQLRAFAIRATGSITC